MTRREKRWSAIVPLTLASALLYGCTYNINVNKNVGLGCASTVGGTSDKDTAGGGSAATAGGDFARQVARSLATDDDCTAALP